MFIVFVLFVLKQKHAEKLINNMVTWNHSFLMNQLTKNRLKTPVYLNHNRNKLIIKNKNESYIRRVFN